LERLPYGNTRHRLLFWIFGALRVPFCRAPVREKVGYVHSSLAYRTATALLVASLTLTPALAFAAPIATPAAAVSQTAGDGSSAISTTLTPSQQVFRDQLVAKQSQLATLQAQLDDLDAQFEIATENYNAAQEQLASTEKKLTLTQTDLANAQRAYDTQLAQLQDRIRLIYQGGNVDTFGLLLESKSLGDLVQRVQFLTVVGQKDADLASQLGNQRDAIQQSLVDLNDAKLQAQQLEFDLKARRIEIQLRIADRQQMLAAAQTDLVTLLGQQATQRQTDEAALLKQILAGASSVGVTVQPGSPVETALAYHGIPYVWAGADPSGFDCSGLVMYVFAQHGVTLPHYSGSQFQLGVPVAVQDLQPSDCVFFGNPIHHVGIYMGNDYFIEAPHTGSYVRVSRLSDRSDYAGARRYPWQIRTAPILGVGSAATSVSSLLPH
jgi:peptidoglycan DL-endopeptidase CwlO